MLHFMLDIETLATTKRAAIVSIACVAFDLTGYHQHYYQRVNLESCLQVGLDIDTSTLNFWLQESDSARAELTHPDRQDIHPTLERLHSWMLNNIDAAGHSQLAVWGKGSDFDNAILESAYKACHLPLPWSHTQNRCFRTLKALFPHINPPAVTEDHVPHHALHDATHQAHHAIAILSSLKS